MLRSAANRRRQNCKTARTWNASLKAISSRYVSWTIQSAAIGWCDQQRVGVGITVGPQVQISITAGTFNELSNQIVQVMLSLQVDSGWCDQQRLGVGRTVGPVLVRDVGLDVLDGVDGLELES